MFVSLYSRLSSFTTPTSLITLNVWFYNTLNSWNLASIELLSYYVLLQSNLIINSTTSLRVNLIQYYYIILISSLLSLYLILS